MSVYGAWQIVQYALLVVKSSLLPKSPSFREILLPLRNRLDLVPEAVWARLFALSIHGTGEQPSIDLIVKDAQDCASRVPGFSVSKALSQLRALGVVQSDLIDAAEERLAA